MNSYGKNVFSASVQRTGVSVQSNMRIFVRLRTEMHTRYFRCSFMSKTSRKQHNIFQVNEAVNSIMLYEGGKGHNIYFELNGVVSKLNHWKYHFTVHRRIRIIVFALRFFLVTEFVNVTFSIRKYIHTKTITRTIMKIYFQMDGSSSTISAE